MKTQKNIIRIITGYRIRDLFIDLYKNLHFYIFSHDVYCHFSYISFTTKIIFKLNYDFYHINTRKNISFTKLHQIYHPIKKESIKLAFKYLTVSHKVSKV